MEIVVAAGFISFAAFGWASSNVAVARAKRNIAFVDQTVNDSRRTSSLYDIAIVGAGPSGSTAAYYLGKHGYKVCLIDKKEFPRSKPCGDAWCAPALNLLEEMGILQKMERDGIVQPVKRGGFISPFGYKCVNTDGDMYGKVTGCKTYAIKRLIADNYLVQAANEHDSVHFFENMTVSNAEFVDTSTGQQSFWNIHVTSTSPKHLDLKDISATLLFVCDGSTSYLGQKLGMVEQGSQSEAVCSHSYIKGDSHTWTEADGVMIFNRSVLPGYSALFRHYNNDMYFGTYVLPGGRATSRAIAPFEASCIENLPYVKDAFGDRFSWEEKRVVAPIRLGGVITTYLKQALLLGDAAGFVDPLTGEGIHTAMISGKIAAECAHEMFSKNNFTLSACEAYELRCHDAFVGEFAYSALAAKMIYRFPILLDATAVVGQRRGQAFLDFFGEVMTGVKPKWAFLRLDLMVDIGIEVLRQIIIQHVLRFPPLMPQDIGQVIVDKNYQQSQRNQ